MIYHFCLLTPKPSFSLRNLHASLDDRHLGGEMVSWLAALGRWMPDCASAFSRYLWWNKRASDVASTTPPFPSPSPPKKRKISVSLSNNLFTMGEEGRLAVALHCVNNFLTRPCGTNETYALQCSSSKGTNFMYTNIMLVPRGSASVRTGNHLKQKERKKRKETRRLIF